MSVTSEKSKEYFTTDLEPVEDKSSDDGEVFKSSTDGENYRTVGWIKGSALMFKVLFSVGILSIPAVFGPVGAVPGSLLVIGWGAFNTYGGFLLGAFRLRHPGMHGLQDMAYVVGGKWYRELVGILYLIGYVLVTGSGIIGVSTAFNALSNHGACTVWFAFVGFVIVTILSAMPRFSQIGVITWVGCFVLYAAVLVVTIGVAVRDRPYLAPKEVSEFGWAAIVKPTFEAGISASLIIFASSSGTSSFVPIIAEMKNPKEYKKPIAASMLLLNVSYLVFSLVIFRYCGLFIASPALGSAGPVIKKISYGLALPGLIITAVLNLHLAAKYLFVRILRDSEHLQKKTTIHWLTWIGAVASCGVVSFVVAEAIPFFGTLIGLVASLSFAPMAIMVPMTLWLHDFGHYLKGSLRQKALWAFHVLFFFIGAFQAVAGAYVMIKAIKDSYAAGLVDKPFSCADNSNSS